MNIDKIVEVNIQISEAMSIDGGYDTILIMGRCRKRPAVVLRLMWRAMPVCRTSKGPALRLMILCTSRPARCLASRRSRLQS
mgnify:FL=1